MLTCDEHDAPCEVGDVVDAELALRWEALVYDSGQSGTHVVAVDGTDAGMRYTKGALSPRLDASTYSAVAKRYVSAGEGGHASGRSIGRRDIKLLLRKPEKTRAWIVQPEGEVSVEEQAVCVWFAMALQLAVGLERRRRTAIVLVSSF